jgi:prepilin-type N-terminal cleavage/methylation domain-containing protein
MGQKEHRDSFFIWQQKCFNFGEAFKEVLMNKKGFTLIELLIVVAIIGIIAAIAIPNLLVALQKGKQKATMGDMKSIGNAIESYITDWSIAPQTDFATLTSATYFVPFYIKILPDRDSWGTGFEYDHGTDLYSVISYGRDKTGPAVPTPLLYDVTRLQDFNNDIYYSNGLFTAGPRVKR